MDTLRASNSAPVARTTSTALAKSSSEGRTPNTAHAHSALERFCGDARVLPSTKAASRRSQRPGGGKCRRLPKAHMMLAAFRAGRRGSSRSRSSNARKAALESTRRRAPSSPAAASFASRWKAVETFT